MMTKLETMFMEAMEDLCIVHYCDVAEELAYKEDVAEKALAKANTMIEAREKEEQHACQNCKDTGIVQKTGMLKGNPCGCKMKSVFIS